MQRKRKKDQEFGHKEVSERIEAHFTKLFTFVKPGTNEMQWVLPKPEDLYKNAAWFDEVMMNMKKELNSVKDRLSDKDIILWRQHTQDVNIASKVVPYVRHKIKAEFCTQAWCKFYEILCTFPLVPQNASSKSLSSVHLCEAPGAFVAALNHYLVLNYPILKWSWLATTLNPYYEGNELGVTIPDDRFILPTLDHWDFGADNTGNLFCSQNRLTLLERAKSVGPISLVTADGSIDCQDNPSEQESSVAMLHLLEAVAALRILAPSGNLVIKLFTFFEHTSVCLLYLLNCAFQQVHVFKPGTSKRGNSEVYVVGLNYIGENEIQDHLLTLETCLGQNTSCKAMFEYQQLPNSFIQQIIACCTYFKNVQIEAILEHLNWFEHISADQKSLLERAKFLVTQMYVQKYGLAQIPFEVRVLKDKTLVSRFFHNKHLREGSFNERSKVVSMSRHQQIACLEDVIKNAAAELEIVAQDVFLKLLPPCTSQQQIDVNVSFGKEFTKCSNSHFCNISLLKCWNKLDLIIRDSGLEIIQTTPMDDSKLADIILSHLTESPLSTYRFLAHHPSCAILAECLQKTSNNEGTSSNAVNTVHLTDLRCVADNWTLLYSSQNITLCLQRFLVILEMLHMRDNFILVVDMLISRVDVGLLWILHQTFEKVILLSFSTCSGSPLELVLCLNCTRPVSPSNLAKFKFAIQRTMEGVAILEVLPISNLFDEPFFSTIFSFNGYVLVQRAAYLINCIKCR